MQHRFLALLAILMISLVSLASQPQGRKHHGGFDPKRFQAELEQMAQYSSVLKDELAALTAPRKHTMHAAKPTDTHDATEEQETAE